YFDKREIDTEKFKRNIVDGILFTVDIEPADDGNISVWLGINSKHKLPNIRLVNASIKNNEKSRRFGYHYLGMDLDNDYCTLRNDTYECDVSLFKSLAQNKLEEYTQKDDFLIKVELEMNAKIVKQSFHIKRKVKKYKITFS
ncbi:MAG: hypothetical protein GY705_23330, partial [Bacteroidetes bacterium]|nr:hypothetical protein [Bacteroidota bacterium]